MTPNLSQKQWSEQEQQLKQTIESGLTIAIHIKNHPNLLAWAQTNQLAVRIDRRTKWGNPFVVDEDGSREEVIGWYINDYWPHKPSLQKLTKELTGKALLCWCSPESCHGDFLASLVNAQ